MFYYSKRFGITNAIKVAIYWRNKKYRDWIREKKDNSRNPIYKMTYKIIEPIVNEYKNESNECVDEKFYFSPGNVWVFWNSGYDNMPEIVKVCYHRLKELEKKQNIIVHLLSDDNYQEYVKIPSQIVNKIDTEKYPTQISNIIRHGLLAQYGGLWLDANYFVSKEIPLEWIYPKGAGTIKRSYLSDIIPHWGRWSSSVLFSTPGSVANRFMYDAYIFYYSHYDIPVDYTMQAQMLTIAYDYFPAVKKDIDSLPDTPPWKKLSDIVNQTYDENKYKEYCDSFPIHKITHKRNYEKVTKNGKITLYGYLVDKYK